MEFSKEILSSKLNDDLWLKRKKIWITTELGCGEVQVMGTELNEQVETQHCTSCPSLPFSDAALSLNSQLNTHILKVDT